MQSLEARVLAVKCSVQQKEAPAAALFLIMSPQRRTRTRYTRPGKHNQLKRHSKPANLNVCRTASQAQVAWPWPCAVPAGTCTARAVLQHEPSNIPRFDRAFRVATDAAKLQRCEQVRRFSCFSLFTDCQRLCPYDEAVMTCVVTCSYTNPRCHCNFSKHRIYKSGGRPPLNPHGSSGKRAICRRQVFIRWVRYVHKSVASIQFE